MKVSFSSFFFAVLIFLSPDIFARDQFREGKYSFTVRGGIAPSAFTSKGEFTPKFVNPNVAPNTTAVLSVPFEFKDLYKTPFILGCAIGYYISDDVELFLNFDYKKASSKLYHLTSKADGPDLNLFNDQGAVNSWLVPDYNCGALNLGVRYYVEALSWGPFLPFLGAKAGMAFTYNTKPEELEINLEGVNIFSGKRNATQKIDRAFTAGLQVGAAFMISSHWDLIFMSEIIKTSGSAYKTEEEEHKKVTVGNFSSTVSKKPNGVISFPVTLGLHVAL